MASILCPKAEFAEELAVPLRRAKFPPFLIDTGRPHGALGNQTPFEFARPEAGHAHLPALHGQQLGWYRPPPGNVPTGPIHDHFSDAGMKLLEVPGDHRPKPD